MLPSILHVFDAVSKRFWRSIEPCISIARVLWIHYGQFGIFLIFSLIRLIVLACQYIIWRRNGVAKKVNRIWDGLAYHESAHILNVHWACKAIPTDKVRLMQLITSHHQFAHPNIVLNDDWMIGEIEPDYVLFIQLKKPLSQYTVRHITFLWADLTYETKRIAIMPITSLQRLSIEMGKPKDDGANVTFLWGSGRCGSTLIAKMVDAADADHLVLSEPPIIMDMYSHKHRMRPKQYERLFESCTRLLVKPVSGKTKIFIKPIFFVTNVAQDMHQVLPKARMLYSYRTPLRTVWGHERAFALTPFYIAMHCVMLTNQWEWGQRLLRFHRYPKIDNVSNRVLGKGFFDLCCIIWADNYQRYQDQANKFYFPAIIYDRLYDNAYQFCAEILAFCGISVSRVEYALELLKGDSQEGSLFSQSLLRGLPITPFTCNQKAKMDRFCDELNLPRFELDNGTNRALQFASSASCSFGVPMPNVSQMTQSCSNNVAEFDYKFITDPSHLLAEIMHACHGYGQSITHKSTAQTSTQKRPLFQPYYKPLPLQIIFSKD